MSTNFYFLDGRHIGKLSRAGYFCWGCREPLVLGGRLMVHTGAPALKACPVCGKEPQPPQQQPEGPTLTGVLPTCSFTWAMQPQEVSFLLLAGAAVEDEYGERLTAEQFLAVLAYCGIEYTRSIGQEFS